MHQNIIDFWFKEIDQSQWWVKDHAFDTLIIERLSNIHNQTINCELFSWRETSLGRLAEVIIFLEICIGTHHDLSLMTP